MTCRRWLNLQEYQSKKLMSDNGVRVQRFFVASTASEALDAAKRLSEPRGCAHFLGWRSGWRLGCGPCGQAQVPGLFEGRSAPWAMAALNLVWASLCGGVRTPSWSPPVAQWLGEAGLKGVGKPTAGGLGQQLACAGLPPPRAGVQTLAAPLPPLQLCPL